MNYTPISAFAHSTADKITGPAIVVPVKENDYAFLVTGGPSPMLCILNGPHAGGGFEAVGGGRWGGVVFGDIEFHVDLTSMAPYSLIGIPLGSLVLSGGAWEIVIEIKSGHGFRDATRFSLEGAERDEARSEDVVFTRWKAFQRRGSELHEVYAFTSDRQGDA